MQEGLQASDYQTAKIDRRKLWYTGPTPVVDVAQQAEARMPPAEPRTESPC